MKIRNEINLISEEFNENKCSHIFLIETNDITRCETDVKEQIKKVLSADATTAMQIDEDEFIDLIIVKPDGKSIKKDQVESLQQRLKTKPVVSNNLFYIISQAETLNEIAANKLLKTIEEPNDNVFGFFITNNTTLLLPTIKSRCEHLVANYHLESIVDVENTEYLKYAGDIVTIIEGKTLLDLNLYLLKNKQCSKYAKEIANTIKDYYNNACGVSNNTNLDKQVLNIIANNNQLVIVHKAQLLNTLLNNINVNMNADLLIEKICIDLKDVKS